MRRTLLVLLLSGCTDPDGPLRVELDGTITTESGDSEPFYARSFDAGNEPGEPATLLVTDWKADGDARWRIAFEVPHEQWQGYEPERTYENDGLLGLNYAEDVREDGFYSHDASSWTFVTDDATDYRLIGELTATFSNGLTYEGRLRAIGLPGPKPGLFADGPLGDDDSCLEGTWTADPGCSDEVNTLTFNSSGTGSITSVDCSGTCVPASQNTVWFDWDANEDETSVTLTYTRAVTCGEDSSSGIAGSSDTLSITCDATSLSFNGATYTR